MGRAGLATNSKREGGGLWGRRVEGEPDVRACMYLRTEGEYPAASPQEVRGEQNFLLCYNERVGLYHEKPPPRSSPSKKSAAAPPTWFAHTWLGCLSTNERRRPDQKNWLVALPLLLLPFSRNDEGREGASLLDRWALLPPLSSPDSTARRRRRRREG